MPAYSMEEMLLEGQMEVKELFEFVTNNAEAMDAYTMEQSIFSRIMAIGCSASTIFPRWRQLFFPIAFGQ